MSINLKLKSKGKSNFNLTILSDLNALGNKDFSTLELINHQMSASDFIEATLNGKFNPAEVKGFMCEISHKLPHLVMDTLKENRKRPG